jgi:hypothetical protein
MTGLPKGFAEARSTLAVRTLELCVGPVCVGRRMPVVTLILRGPDAEDVIAYTVCVNDLAARNLVELARQPTGMRLIGTLPGSPGSSLYAGRVSVEGIDASGRTVVATIVTSSSFTRALRSVEALIRPALAHAQT